MVLSGKKNSPTIVQNFGEFGVLRNPKRGRNVRVVEVWGMDFGEGPDVGI
jgi:hypothetical protein